MYGIHLTGQLVGCSDDPECGDIDNCFYHIHIPSL